MTDAATQTEIETGTEDDRTLVIRRHFAAPREAVFRAWTEPETLRQWWASLVRALSKSCLVTNSTSCRLSIIASALLSSKPAFLSRAIALCVSNTKVAIYL